MEVPVAAGQTGRVAMPRLPELQHLVGNTCPGVGATRHFTDEIVCDRDGRESVATESARSSGHSRALPVAWGGNSVALWRAATRQFGGRVVRGNRAKYQVLIDKESLCGENAPI